MWQSVALWGEVWQRGDIVSSVRVMDGSWQGHLTHNFLFYHFSPRDIAEPCKLWPIHFVKEVNKKFSGSQKYDWFIGSLFYDICNYIYFGDRMQSDLKVRVLCQFPPTACCPTALVLGPKRILQSLITRPAKLPKGVNISFQKSFVIKRFQNHFCVPADFTLMEIIHWGL